ncbi:MAG: DUF11 domain-containing protein [Desulfuromonadales bacterium]|nr:DUF11 domain-containing protein [Desulfuromonadales bacterium]
MKYAMVIKNSAHNQANNKLAKMVILSFLLFVTSVTSAFAWPSSSQWIPVPKGGTAIQDPQGDAQGARNIVPDDNITPAAYIYNDGINIYFRFRLDDDPTGSGGQGLLQSFGWGFEIDTDQNADDYEWLMILDGISSPEVIRLMENTVKSQLGDPSDTAEDVISPYPLSGNYRITAAETCFDSGKNPGGVCNASNQYQDYFLDYKLPYSVFKAATGITDNTLVRFFVGSSSSANNLTENGADLVAGSDLYAMASDYVTPFGFLTPDLEFYDGGVRFVNDLNGAFDSYVAAPGDDIFIRIDDLDLSSDTNPGGTIVVTVTSPTGDSERVTLYATGVAGKYTGTLPTATTDSDGTLHILSGQTATVTYAEAIDASLNQNVTSGDNTDTIYFTSAGTDIAISKSVDFNNRTVGQPVSFTITATNNGPSNVSALTVNDLIPSALDYVSYTASQGTYDEVSGDWNITTNLAAGSSETLVINATVNPSATGTIINNVSWSSSTPTDGYSGNNSDDATVYVGGTDIKITKDVSDSVPVSGDTITFTLRAINLGPSNTNSVTVTDLLPAGLTFVSTTASQGSYNSTSGLWTVGTLNSGFGAQLIISATVSGANGQEITNNAALTNTSQPDINSANNTANTTVQIGYTDLSIDKVARKLTPPAGPSGKAIAANIGNDVEFTVTLTNNGPHTATNITVRDLVPTGMTLLSATPSAGSYNSGTGDWTLASLADDASATLVMQASVNSGTAGQVLVNEARIVAVDQPDQNPGDEIATATVAVNGTDLEVTKVVTSPNPATPSPGSNVTWTVTVVNNGPNPASSIVITDLLPDGVTYVSHTASTGTYDAGKQNSNYQWAIPTLTLLNQATLQIVTSVDAGTEGETIVNNAFLTSASVTDADESNNVGSAFIAVSGTDLRITKTATPQYPSIGDTVTYTLTAYNDGPNNAAGVVVNDQLPPEVSYVSHSGGSYNPTTGVWSVGTLNSGANSQLTIQTTVLSEDDLLLITNTAEISAPGVGDPDPSNNIATADINVGATDLSISKDVSNPTPAPGQSIDYTVTVKNLSGNDSTGVEIEDILPAGVTYDSHTVSQGAYAFGLWVVGDIENLSSAYNSATLTITATVDSPTAGIPIGSIITNTADLLNVDQVDTDSSNNSKSVDITLAATPIISLQKTLQTVFDPVHGFTNPFNIPGAVVEYTIRAQSTGSAATTSGTVMLSDPIPANTTMYVGPAGGSTSPVTFTDGSGLSPAQTDSGLTYSFIDLEDLNDNLQFYDGTTWDYQPTPDTEGYDSNVQQFRINFGGTIDGASGGNNPTFEITFRVRVK